MLDEELPATRVGLAKREQRQPGELLTCTRPLTFSKRRGITDTSIPRRWHSRRSGSTSESGARVNAKTTWRAPVRSSTSGRGRGRAEDQRGDLLLGGERGGVVVEEPDRQESELRVLAHSTLELAADHAGADDEGRDGAGAAPAGAASGELERGADRDEQAARHRAEAQEVGGRRAACDEAAGSEHGDRRGDRARQDRPDHRARPHARRAAALWHAAR
ncbi:MAG: hypothetical protein PGN13_06010 [Patulibacter minatonensis]